MKQLILAFLAVASTGLSMHALADCRDIVASTIAELRAGSADWNEDMERLARAAAGSACVKASSAQASDSGQIREQAVRAGESSAGKTVATSEPTPAAEAAAAAEGDGEESWNPFKDIKFNKVSASPNKKPYERRREVNNKEAPENAEE